MYTEDADLPGSINPMIAMIEILVLLCAVCALWIWLTERNSASDDWFRRRWGGSDARIIEKDEP